MEKVLIVGDGRDVRKHLEQLATEEEIEVHAIENGYEALEAVETFRPAICFMPNKMADLDGIQLLRHLKEVDSDLEVIFITEPEERDLFVDALELGACDSIARPLNGRMVRMLLQRARERIWLRNKLASALDEIQARHNFEHKLIHTSMDGIIANDRRGNIIVFNEGASRIYGFAPEEAISRIDVTRLYPAGEARAIKKRIYGPDFGGPGKLVNYETKALSKDERLVPILLSATLIYEGHEEVATVGYFKDLTNFKR